MSEEVEMLNKTKPGTRRGPKPKGVQAEVVLNFDQAVQAQASEIESCIYTLNTGRLSAEDKDAISSSLRAGVKNLRLLAYIAKEMKPKGARSKTQMRHITPPSSKSRGSA